MTEHRRQDTEPVREMKRGWWRPYFIWAPVVVVLALLIVWWWIRQGV